MAGHDLRANPLAIPGAPAPRVHRVRANGTGLYAEERGAGSAILIIPGGAEDAEGWRPVAERLGAFRVITYDRRGTLRSGRDDWPGQGAAQHADDAAGLLDALDAADAVVVGGSSGGVVAVELALRHPRVVRRALAYEPGYLRWVEAGLTAQADLLASVAEYLEAHPGDWLGGYGVFARTTELAPGHEWFALREERNAEAFLRDDVPILTAELVDERAIAGRPVDIRFAHGTETLGIFREIATRLAALRDEEPDVLEGVGHSLNLHPDAAAAWVARHASR